jgi:hypothetical protein
MSSYTDDSVTDESLWTDGNDTELPPYRRSKTLVGRDAEVLRAFSASWPATHARR